MQAQDGDGFHQHYHSVSLNSISFREFLRLLVFLDGWFERLVDPVKEIGQDGMWDR